MKPGLKFTAFVLLTGVLFYISCKKELPCENCTDINKPPISNAGPDQVITLPTDSVSLDGTASSDPDGKIGEWLWTKISGPASFNILQQSDSITKVKALVTGTYQFELKVTDGGGLFSKDTIQISVHTATPSPTNCDISTRPLVPVQLIPLGTFSQERRYVTIAAAGNKILFAGGSDTDDGSSQFTRVDIYDTLSHDWSVAELGVARYNMEVVTFGNKVFFSGGHTVNQNSWNLFSIVDIYDAVTNTWSNIQLSERRMDLAAALVGNKILFAGGLGGPANQPPVNVSDKVDIYDLVNNTWSTTKLSQARACLSGTTAGNKIYFAGGNTMHTGYTASCAPSSRIDIYDNSTNSWTVASMNKPVSNMAAIGVAGKIYWAGGQVANCNTSSLSNEVEIFNSVLQTSSYSCLFQPNARFKAVVKNDNIIFFTGEGSIKDKFDIYNTTTGTWSIGALPQSVGEADIYSYNNVIYIANHAGAWKLEF